MGAAAPKEVAMFDISTLKFDEKGLIPAVVVDTETKKVLNVAYMNEEILRTTISKAVELYEETDPRGEYVLVVEGAKDAPAAQDGYPEDPQQHVQALMESGMDRMDAIKSAAKERGMSKGAFYKLLLGTSGEE